MTKFNIGDHAYYARAGQEPTWITCPECFGSGHLRVILGDDSEVSIACVCCERGYEGSPGKIQSYKFQGEAEPIIITGVEVYQRDGEIHTRYSTYCGSGDEKDIFATREEALEHTNILVAEHEAEEIKRLGYKEKQHKTWAWNVSYWRGLIRRAKRDIESAEARLNVAPQNVKEADKQ